MLGYPFIINDYTICYRYPISRKFLKFVHLEPIQLNL